jgi:hypothetical protein
MTQIMSWSQLPCSLRLRSLTSRTLRSWVRIPPRIWMCASTCVVLCLPCDRQIPCATKCLKDSLIHNNLWIYQRALSIKTEGEGGGAWVMKLFLTKFSSPFVTSSLLSLDTLLGSSFSITHTLPTSLRVRDCASYASGTTGKNTEYSFIYNLF